MIRIKVIHKSTQFFLEDDTEKDFSLLRYGDSLERVKSLIASIGNEIKKLNDEKDKRNNIQDKA